MSAHPDVLIVGGGVIGLTTAYFLRKAGASVAVVDQADFGRESSWAGAGILSPAPTLARAQTPHEQLAAHSARLHPLLAAELRETTGVDNGYLRRGGWALFEEDEPVPLAQWKAQGISFEDLRGHVHDREPALDPGSHRTFFLPEMGQLRNPRHLKALLAWCGQNDVQLRPGCPVVGFDHSGSRVTAVLTAAGSLTAGRVLITAGAWSEGLLAPLGWRPGIKPVRGQIVLLAGRAPVLARVVEAGKRYLVPRPDGRVLVGSTEEDAGFDKQTTAAGVAGLLDFALEMVPALADLPLERTWAGLRPGSPDGWPFLGPVPGCDNLFVAAGHHRAGIQLSTGTALAMKEMLLDEPPTLSGLEAFRLDRAGQAAFRS